MRYVKFEIENYKGIRHLELNLDAPPRGRVFTLVGLNESGKTTILEALSQFSGAQEDLAPMEINGPIEANPNDLVPIAQRANFNGTIEISATVRLSDKDKNDFKRFLKRDHQITAIQIPDQVRVSDKFEFASSIFQRRHSIWPQLGQVRGHREKKPWAFTKQRYGPAWVDAARWLRDRMPPILYFPNFLFDFPDRIYLAEQQDEGTGARFYRAVLQDVLNSLNLGLEIEEHLHQRAISENRDEWRALTNLLLRMSRALTRDVFESWEAILKRGVGMRIKLEVESDPDEPKNPFVTFQIEDDDGFFAVSERSLGFRWFFVFILLTKYRGERADGYDELIYLFDEPASNLHSSAQVQLLESLDRFSEKVRVMYTTHSHHLINPEWLEQTYVVRNAGAQALEDVISGTARTTDIAIQRYREFVSFHPDQTQYFQPVLDVLEYSPSRLELVPDLVLVEGKNDFYSLRFGVLSGALDGLNFYPGGGAGSLDQVIALYLSWGRKFVVLLDSDEEGKNQRKRYEDRFGPVVSGRLFDLGDFVPALEGESMEALIAKELPALCLAMSVAPPTGKKQINRLLQEAVATKISVELTEAGQDSFASLHTGLRGALDAL